MAHLMKLEMKKFRLLHNILFTLAAVLFSILFITVSLVDSMTDPLQTKDSFESTFLVIGLLMSFIFLVYSSVLTSRLVIREYEQKTITILFSYPLNRKQLIISKLVIIMAYTAISMTVGYICCSAYIILADKFFNMVAGSFKLYFLLRAIFDSNHRDFPIWFIIKSHILYLYFFNCINLSDVGLFEFKPRLIPCFQLPICRAYYETFPHILLIGFCRFLFFEPKIRTDIKRKCRNAADK